jgi:hypothetical protein
VERTDRRQEVASDALGVAEDGHRGDAEATSRGIGSAKPKNA